MLYVLNYVSTSTYPINLNFSAVFHIYQIHVFDGAGSLFAFMTMIIEKLLMFPWLILFTSLIETNFFIAIMQLINPSYLWKDEVKQIKVLKQKLLQRCIFTRSLRIQPLKSYCFSFLPSFVIYLSGIDLLNMSFFLNLHHGQFGQFVLRTFSKELY